MIVPPAIVRYRRFLLFIAGMGGVLFGYDIGIVADALLYVDKTIALNSQEASRIVSAVSWGGVISVLVAGALADWFGRRTILITSAGLFLASVVILACSYDYVSLGLGRLLQGFSVGMIAVVIPLYLAECLPSEVRGRGITIFQLFLTIGILSAMLVGGLLVSQVSALPTTDQVALHTAQDHAWRLMFASAGLPGVIFLIGGFFLAESPRWLVRRGQVAQARSALQRSRLPSEVEAELASMPLVTNPGTDGASQGSLLQRRYVIPFLITCLILALNQATGINSIIPFGTIILKQAGLPDTLAAYGSIAITATNVLFTAVAFLLVDRRGRTFLLKIGTAGIILSLVACALLFQYFERMENSVTAEVKAAVIGNQLDYRCISEGPDLKLRVLFDDGKGERQETVVSSDKDPVLHVKAVPGETLTIVKASIGQVPSPAYGWATVVCLLSFIASFAIGPGVCVWLALSELMPTRIRSQGMGIALAFNTGISAGIGTIFLPTVQHYGYALMFFCLAGATVIYFLASAFILPETRGLRLEQIENLFVRNQEAKGQGQGQA